MHNPYTCSQAAGQGYYTQSIHLLPSSWTRLLYTMHTPAPKQLDKVIIHNAHTCSQANQSLHHLRVVLHRQVVQGSVSITIRPIQDPGLLILGQLTNVVSPLRNTIQITFFSSLQKKKSPRLYQCLNFCDYSNFLDLHLWVLVHSHTDPLPSLPPFPSRCRANQIRHGWRTSIQLLSMLPHQEMSPC